MEQAPNIRAENNAKFYSRFKWLALGAFAFGLWSVYDGIVTYPDQKVRADALLEIAKERIPESEWNEAREGAHGLNDIYLKLLPILKENDVAWEAWQTMAADKGWDAIPPTKARTDGDIAGQFVMAGLCALASIYFLGVIIKTTGRWFEIDGETIRTSGGLSFAASSITEIDKRQWIDKGIARLKYDENGASRKFVVDNYKYLREETDAILYHIEQIAGADKIINGPPEKDPSEEADSTEPAAASSPEPAQAT